MQVESKKYDVYPDLRSITNTLTRSSSHDGSLSAFHANRQQTAILRQISLEHFYIKLADQLKKQAQDGKIAKS